MAIGVGIIELLPIFNMHESQFNQYTGYYSMKLYFIARYLRSIPNKEIVRNLIRSERFLTHMSTLDAEF